MKTYKIENGALVYQSNGSFVHHDFKAEFKENGKYKGLGYVTLMVIPSFLKTFCC